MGPSLLSPTGYFVVTLCLTETTEELFGAFTGTATEDAVPELSALSFDFSYSCATQWLTCGCLFPHFRTQRQELHPTEG